MTHERVRGAAATVACLLALAGCTSDGSDASASPSPSIDVEAAPAGTPSPSPSPLTSIALPELATAPPGDMNLWATTIGLPVTAAIRTATPLARLADTPLGERPTVCRQVAAELDAIAAPQLLSGLAITADAETATLLVGDLQAKADLLAACVAGGPPLEELIAEVERTHAVAVAWLAVLRGDA